MDTFLRGIALVLLGVILSLILSRQSRDLGILLSIAVCAMVCISATQYLRSVTDFLDEILLVSGLDRQYLSILLKCTGIGFLAELAGLICTDAGEGAMAKAIQILSNAAILYLSIPLMQKMLALLEEVLGQI